MSTSTLEYTPKTAQEPTDQIRLPKSVVRRIRRLSGHLDQDPKDIILPCLLPFIERMETQMIADLQQEQGYVSDTPKRKRS